MSSDEGFLYIVTGDKFLNEAIRSAERLREVDPDANITLISDREPESSVFDRVDLIEQPFHSHQDKVAHIRDSPYSKTIFLDSDTYVCSGLSDLFDLLDRYDFAAAHDSGRRRELYVEDKVTVNAPEAFPMVNSGVMAFRETPDVADLFDSWSEVYSRHRQHKEGVVNQPSLREALYHSGVSMTVLPPEYNCRTPYPPYIRGEVKLIHGRDAQPDKVCSAINAPSEDIRRTFYVVNINGKSRVRVRPEKWPQRIDLIWMSLVNRGIFSTLKNLIGWLMGGDFNQ